MLLLLGLFVEQPIVRLCADKNAVLAGALPAAQLPVTPDAARALVN